MKFQDLLQVTAVSHGEDDVGNSPGDKDEDDAGYVCESGETSRPVYD